MECPDGPRDCCLCPTGQNVVSSPAGAGGRHRDARVPCGFVSWGGGAGHGGSSLDPGPSRGSGDTERSKGVLLRVQSHWATWEMCRKDAGANTHRLLFCFLPNRAARCGSAGCTRSSSARCPSWVSGSRRERPHVRPARAPAAGPATALSALPVWPVGSVFSGIGEFGRHTCSAHTCTPAGVHMRMHTCTHACAHARTRTVLGQNRALCAPLLGTRDPSSPSVRVVPSCALLVRLSVLHLCHYLQLSFRPVSFELKVQFSFW